MPMTALAAMLPDRDDLTTALAAMLPDCDDLTTAFAGSDELRLIEMVESALRVNERPAWRTASAVRDAATERRRTASPGTLPAMDRRMMASAVLDAGIERLMMESPAQEPLT